ncbi:MAG: hypothetical protein MJ252_29300 [archaeon]|nr:hypothetical protein [archaeon]
MNEDPLERTSWIYKVTNDKDLGNHCDEILLNFKEKQKFELNLNKFRSQFNIDLNEFLDEEKSKGKEITDDIFDCGKY